MTFAGVTSLSLMSHFDLAGQTPFYWPRHHLNLMASGAQGDLRGLTCYRV